VWRFGQARAFSETALAVGDDGFAGDEAFVAGFERDVIATADLAPDRGFALPVRSGLSLGFMAPTRPDMNEEPSALNAGSS
jgi:hypothetical protein